MLLLSSGAEASAYFLDQAEALTWASTVDPDLVA